MVAHPNVPHRRGRTCRVSTSDAARLLFPSALSLTSLAAAAPALARLCSLRVARAVRCLSLCPAATAAVGLATCGAAPPLTR